MGMPITTYTVLREIARGNIDSSIKQAIAPYNLFAFIIHDHQDHSKFNKHLHDRFDYYDYITGQHLLFFALLEPQESWLNHGKHRSYYQKLLNWRPTKVSEKDKTFSALSLAVNLGIPIDALPCLVVTTDFEAREFQWFKTSVFCLEEQLKRLGFIAARNEQSEIQNAVRNAQVDLCGASGLELLADKISKKLSDILSFTAVKEESPVQVLAGEHSKDVLYVLSTSIRSLKQELKESGEEYYHKQEFEEFDNLCFKVLTLTSLQEAPRRADHTDTLSSRQNERTIGPQPQLVEIPDYLRSLNSPILEKESVLILKTALRVHDVLTDHNHSGEYRTEIFDFTPTVICLSKVFEKEVNLSIVHWIRQELGVTLPPYFNKPQPNMSAKFLPSDIPDPREIDFNRARAGIWWPPGIGESEIASRSLGKIKIPEGWDARSWQALLAQWGIIRKHRNRAAHTDLINEQDAENVVYALERLASMRMFLKFCRLKCRYRGEEFNDINTEPY